MSKNGAVRLVPTGPVTGTAESWAAVEKVVARVAARTHAKHRLIAVIDEADLSPEDIDDLTRRVKS
jgi:ribosomal protein L20A (L18A)